MWLYISRIYREICNGGKQTYCLDGNPVFLWVITYLVTKYYCVHIFRAQNYLELDVGFFFKKRLFAYCSDAGVPLSTNYYLGTRYLRNVLSTKPNPQAILWQYEIFSYNLGYWVQIAIIFRCWFAQRGNIL